MIHIGRKRAAPDKCPECGRSPPKLKGGSFSDILNWAYSEPKVYSKTVWDGAATTWYFSCAHTDTLEPLLRGPSWLDHIKKDDKWKGGTIPVPFKYSGES